MNPAAYRAQVLSTRGTYQGEPQTHDDLRRALAKAVLKSRRDALIRERDPGSVGSESEQESEEESEKEWGDFTSHATENNRDSQAENCVQQDSIPAMPWWKRLRRIPPRLLHRR